MDKVLSVPSHFVWPLGFFCWYIPLQWPTFKTGVYAAPDWCSMDTGQTTIQDGKGLPHSVYISVTRDGSVWIRAGQDYKSQDWIYHDERIHSYPLDIIESDTISLLESIEYMDYCVLSDVNMLLRAERGWHPSYLSVFDPQTKGTRILHFRRDDKNTIRTCNSKTNFTLNRTKQSIMCHGGQVKSCGMIRGPYNSQEQRTLFIKGGTFDPHGAGYYECDSGESDTINAYTFTGSFYHVFVKVYECQTPKDSRVLGHDAKLRAFPHNDDARNTIIIPDPSQTAINDGVIRGWRVFVKVISIQHEVFLQVWRPTNDENLYTLVGQTFYQPPELRFQEITLPPDQYIRIQKGDVLGFYFPRKNPIAWSTIPCAFDIQAHRYIEHPADVSVGTTKEFNMAHFLQSGACRHYSLTAVFANKSHAKLVEDWICPTAHPPAGMRRRSGAHRKQKTDTSNKNTDGSNVKTKSTNGNKVNTKPQFSGTIPLHLILIIIGCLILLLGIVGFISYYRAVRS